VLGGQADVAVDAQRLRHFLAIAPAAIALAAVAFGPLVDNVTDDDNAASRDAGTREPSSPIAGAS
jgi:hypothetical protein